jgi:hypothetical protein
MTDILNTLGIVIAIGISIAGYLVNASRSKQQNMTDMSAYAKNLAETTSMATKGRLEAEQRSKELEKEIEELKDEYAELRKLVNAMAYRVMFVVHTGEDPRIEKISVERFPERRFEDKPVDINHRR